MDLSGLLVRLILMTETPDPESLDFGIYSRTDMHAKGFSDNEIRRLLCSENLTNPKTGWYGIGTANERAISAMRKGGVLACVSALQERGYWVAPGYPTLHFRMTKYTGKTVGECRGHGSRKPIKQAIDPAPLALAYAVECMSAEDWIATCDI